MKVLSKISVCVCVCLVTHTCHNLHMTKHMLKVAFAIRKTLNHFSCLQDAGAIIHPGISMPKVSSGSAPFQLLPHSSCRGLSSGFLMLSFHICGPSVSLGLRMHLPNPAATLQ